MSFTETTHTSWFARLRNGVAAIFIGLLLVVVSIGLLFWNEGRAIETYRSLVEGASKVVDVDATRIDPAHEGQLVHVSGPIKPVGTPEDEVFGISAPGAFQVTRAVQMYQWVENKSSKTEKKLGGGEETVTTYDYAKEWRGDVIDSTEFRQQDEHQNPQRLIDPENFAVEKAELGAFTVIGSQAAGLGASKPISLDAQTVTKFGQALGSKAQADAGGIYVGQNRSAPAVGDLRVTYQRVDLKEASFVAAQKGTMLADYRSSNGRGIFLSSAGIVSADTMFADAQSLNAVITWLVRAGGLLLMFIGFAMMFSLLSIIADLIPFVGSIVGFGTSLVALVLTLVLGPVVIAIGWFAYRPLLAVGMIAAGLVVAYLVVRLKRKTVAPVASVAG
jgi:hypothetical protein